MKKLTNLFSNSRMYQSLLMIQDDKKKQLNRLQKMHIILKYEILCLNLHLNSD